MDMITPAQLRQQLPRGTIQLIDVREVHEWTAGHIEGATHIPLGDLVARAGELDPQRDVVCYCRVGGRSSHACALLTAQGFAKVQNLEGGILAFNRLPPAD